ncbi:flagellar basal-body MS-ring/collar protein FliF [Anaerobacillus isosaccharinicus]|uniref:Flagellar M-ring protein n=1 Tax=Anaerobacillus isosaccharinicus TaxID=1532552 RepID=A0A1S2L731_9BACI|nr:flagellar basal-body MS-ring/collar protein FliF [Anaerobacillus isosaccharinicus]MBA5587340.1 flagellar M-ring protein FliF [Anaerobacillus isosaccharinicus]QOY34466.1 flagellar M-ring protein FliF [Anaerobacillus isosaccharinicus]
MNEKLLIYKDKATKYWTERTNVQKGIIVGSFLLLLLLIIFVSMLGSRTNMVPLYTNLSFQETGEIKAQLDSRGIPSEVTSSGTAINVPETLVDSLKVELAAEGIPKSGSIDYTTFRDRMGFGMTDNEFTIMERAAMQTELANLIRNMDGVQHAQVMITLPEESMWVSMDDEAASASIILNIRPGYQLDQSQIRALYHLVSKSVPKLPIDNIVIMNQMFEYLELKNENIIDSTLSTFEQQRSIQREIERDLQRQVQQMLGTLVGRDKVLVSVTTDIDFTKENRAEDLVTPVDPENMSGLAVSIERITETFSGEDFQEGGIPGTGETDIPGYPGGAGAGAGDYERMEERINNDVNRIRRDIVMSPYQVKDIGIQVMIEPPNPEDPASLPVELLGDVQQILSTIVRTSISKDVIDQLTPEQINDKVFVSAHTFEGKIVFEDPAQGIPSWYYIVGGLILFIILLIFLLIRKNKKVEVIEETSEQAVSFDIPDIGEDRDSEEKARRRQLEKMAKEKPEEFSKLVRTWLSED